MHWLLKKQLRKLGIQVADGVDAAAMSRLLERIGQTYEQADRERYLLERSLAISSEEMQDVYGRLLASSEAQIREERDRFSAVIDALQLCYVVLKPDGRIDSANPEARVVSGYDESEVVDQEFSQVLAPGSSVQSRRTRQILKQTLSNLGTTDLRVAQFVRRSGEPYTAAFTLSALRKGGTLQGFMLAFRDVTVIRRAEERIRRSERLYRTIARNFPNGSVFLFDRSLRYQLADGSDLRRRGLSQESVEGRTLREVFDNKLADELEPLYKQALDGQAISHEMRYEGNVYRAHIIPIRDESGEVYAGMAMTQDVTEAKLFESELIAAKERAEEVSQIKSSLIRNITHEVRTPLASILGFASILVQEIDGQPKEFAELIHRSGVRLDETLRSVLEVGQLDGGSLPFDVRAIDVNELLSDELAILEPIANAKELHLSLELEQTGLQCIVDRSSLSRIVRNLVHNAVKFTDKGGIVIRARQRGDMIEIQVEDTGIGINEEFLPHVFDEFSQQSTGIGRTHEGVGLGLAITQKLITLMGGTIAVRSQPSVGTCFTVAVPALSEPEPVTGARLSQPNALLSDSTRKV